MHKRYVTALGLTIGLCMSPRAVDAQDDEGPAVDRAAFPALPPIPAASAQEVSELRALVRRTNRCRDVEGDRDRFMEPEECYAWFQTISEASTPVRDHAVGSELVRRMMRPEGRHLEVRLFEKQWLTILSVGGENAVRYLMRAVTLLDGPRSRYAELTRLVLQALEQLTYQPVDPYPPWIYYEEPRDEDYGRMREAWLAWYRAKASEGLERWRADGLAAHRANLEGEDSTRIAVAVEALWEAEVPDRVELIRAALRNPHLVGQGRQYVHGHAVSRRWGRPLSSRESYGLSREAARARRRLRAARPRQGGAP